MLKVTIENFGQGDGAVGLLVGFDQGHVEAGEGRAGAVECVAGDVFAIGGFVAQCHAAGLEVFKVAAGGDFEVAAFAGGPDFDVVTFGSAKAHVACAEQHGAVVQTEELQHSLGVVAQGFEGVIRVLGAGDPDEFHFVELVHADEAAGVAPGTASFLAEARRVGGEADGEVGFFEEHVAVEVCDGHFGSGREEEGVRGVGLGGAIHVLLEFGELAGAGHAVAVNKVGGRDLGVSVLRGVEVEEEVDEGAFKTCAGAAIDGEAGAGDFGGGSEVHPAEVFEEFGVGFGRKGEWRLFAPGGDDGVVGSVGAGGNGVVRDVGHKQAQGSDALFGVAGGGLGLGELLGDNFPLMKERGGVFFLSFGLANGFGGAVFCSEEGFTLLSRGAPLAIGFEPFIEGLCGFGAAGGQAAAEGVRIFAGFADVEHGNLLSRRGRCGDDFL